MRLTYDSKNDTKTKKPSQASYLSKPTDLESDSTEARDAKLGQARLQACFIEDLNINIFCFTCLISIAWETKAMIPNIQENTSLRKHA